MSLSYGLHKGGQFTKAEFYRDFSNVVKTKSYKEDGIYHYSVTPKRALSYLIDEACVPGHNQVTCKDLVGDDIRSKIREIGALGTHLNITRL